MDGKNSPYNCSIGVSGGKDSTRQSIYVRDHLKLKPILICCSYPPEQISEIGAANIENLNELGFDKLLGKGSITKKYKIIISKTTNLAKKKIEKAGGEVITG